MSSKLIVALDFANEQKTWGLIEQLDPSQCALKIGSELFTFLGPVFVKKLVDQNFKVFLDLKFHDIPNTVSKACSVAADLGVWMLNVHASGGEKMLLAARQVLDEYGANRPLLIAVTVLTSLNDEDLKSIAIDSSLYDQVGRLALMAKNAGLDGVVSSPHEVKLIKHLCGKSFLTVTPGIRLEQSTKDDQTRIMTPAQAISEGSDYLVIGRPITQAADPVMMVHEITQSL